MPESFSARSLIDLADLVMGQSPDSQYVYDDLEHGLPFLQGNAEFGDVHPHPGYSCLQPARACKKNDVLISVRAPVGEINVADTDYCIGRGLAAIRFQNIPATLGIKLISKFSPALKRVAQGTTFEAVGKNELASLEVLVPPSSEWEEIAQILDTLDTQIRQTEALIAKLERIKQGLLTDLLTRGIDDNGQLRPTPDQAPHLYKDSPLGLMPREWGVMKLGEVALTTTLGTACRGRGGKGDRLALLKMGNLQWDNRFSFEKLEMITSSLVSPTLDVQDGDLLFNTRNTPELVGKTCAWRGDGAGFTFDNNILRLRCSAQCHSGHYYALYMGSEIGRRRLFQLSTGTTSVAAIYWRDLSRFFLPMPPVAEQVGIADRVYAAEDRITQLFSEKAKLHREKQGLMNDLLTGRVRVTPLLAD